VQWKVRAWLLTYCGRGAEEEEAEEEAERPQLADEDYDPEL